jgi:hypothetical protein
LIAGVPLAWIAIRALFDVKECRLAGTLMLTAFASYAAAITSFLGFFPATQAANEALITGVATFLGHWLALAAIVSYARYVVLDAQGLVTVRRPAAKKQAAKEKPVRETKPALAQPTVLSAAGYTRQPPKPVETPATADKWVDGTRPERDSYDDADADEDDDSSGVRKLSKADRKRLRKLKAQNRAA